MVSFEVQFFHEVKPNLTAVSPVIKKYKVKSNSYLNFRSPQQIHRINLK